METQYWPVWVINFYTCWLSTSLILHFLLKKFIVYFIFKEVISHVESRCKEQHQSTVFLCEDESLMKNADSKNATNLIRYFLDFVKSYQNNILQIS
jgi:hypothetical protein